MVTVIKHLSNSKAEGETTKIKVVSTRDLKFGIDDFFESNFTLHGGVSLERGTQGPYIYFVFGGGIKFLDYVSLNFSMTVGAYNAHGPSTGGFKTALAFIPLCLMTPVHGYPITNSAETTCGSIKGFGITVEPKGNPEKYFGI